MSRSNHTEAQMIGALKQVEVGRKVEDVAREVGVSKHTLYAWKAKYGGMDVSQAQEVKQLRDENARLKKLVADLSLDKDALQWVIEKNG
jgi:putative transposase